MSSFKQTKIDVYEFDDSVKDIPLVFDDRTISMNLLKIRPKTFHYMMLSKDNLYRKFAIPKKNREGRILKWRKIQAPEGALKATHTVLNSYLSSIPLPDNVSAYVPGKNCVDAAKKHVGKGVIIGLDISNFFNSTRRSWIREYFNHGLGLNYVSSSWLATCCTVYNVVVPNKKDSVEASEEEVHKVHYLPQGSPISGYLANLVFWHRAGKRIKAALFEEDPMWEFTVYSDDITLSHPDKIEREKVDQIIEKVTSIIESAGYKVNRKKTRVLRTSNQQRVLGVVVNEKANIPKVKYNKLRCLIHNCKNHGFESQAERCGKPNGKAVQQYIRGMLQYFKQIREDRFIQLNTEFEEAIELHKQDGEDFAC